MAKLPMITNQRVLRTEIHVDKGGNSRKGMSGEEYKKGIAELASSMKKAGGPMFPPLLMRISQAGKGYEGRKESYLLVAGFRRQEAMDSLEITEYDYRLAPADWDLADGMSANLVENLGRKDLTSYETAAHCYALHTEHGKSAMEIAASVKANDAPDAEGKVSSMSKSHVENLIRLCKQLHPQIQKAWRDGHPKASIKTLLKIAANKSEQGQLNDWKGVNEVAAAGKGKKTKGNKNAVKRPSAAAIGIMITRVKDDDKKAADWRKGALAALAWAAGIKENIPGIKFDAPAKANGEGEEDAEDAEDFEDEAEGEGAEA